MSAALKRPGLWLRPQVPCSSHYGCVAKRIAVGDQRILLVYPIKGKHKVICFGTAQSGKVCPRMMDALCASRHLGPLMGMHPGTSGGNFDSVKSVPLVAHDLALSLVSGPKMTTKRQQSVQRLIVGESYIRRLLTSQVRANT
jgi:hypothetical protein